MRYDFGRMSNILFNICIIVLYVILFVVIWFGNSLVCVVIWCVRVLRIVFNMVIFSLVFVDLFMMVVFMYWIIYFLSGEELYVVCYVFFEIVFNDICVIILYLIVISVDRFIVIKFLFCYKILVIC